MTFHACIANNVLRTSAFRCIAGLTFADPAECTRFYLCIDDQEVVLATCPNAYHYSTQFSACLPPEDAGCEEGTVSIVFLENKPSVPGINCKQTAVQEDRTITSNMHADFSGKQAKFCSFKAQQW